MSILNKLDQMILEDYKSGNQQRRIYLQMIKSELINKEKETGAVLTEEMEIQVLKKQFKQQQESLNEYQKAGRDDLAKKIKFEIEILNQFIPEEASDDEIRNIIKKKIAQAEDKNFGKLMGLIMAEVGSKADGNRVSRLLKEELND